MLRSRLFGCVLILWCACATVRADTAMFAAHAAAERTATSPDGKSVVSLRLLDETAEDFPTEVSVRTPRGSLTSTIRFGLNPEILWSDDSRAFSVTGSCCGGNGQYQTDVFFIAADKLVRISLTNLIERAFGHPVKCGWPESPNVAGIKWLNAGSKLILVAAEIRAHSNCDSFGTFNGFVVDVRSRRIIRTYNQLQVKRRFAVDLGPELRDANDACVRDPETCFVSSNHPELR